MCAGSGIGGATVSNFVRLTFRLAYSCGMGEPATAAPAGPRRSRNNRSTGRDAAIDRYLELRPAIRARMEASVPEELRSQFSAVTAHQLRALALLRDGGLSMRQLAAALGVVGATTSVLADRLVAQGLAVREHDPDDRRVVRLVLTEPGRRVASKYLEAQRRAARALFDRLSEGQIDAWLDVLETLAAPGGDAGAEGAARRPRGGR